MALFQSDVKETVRRLSNKEFASPEERDELLARLAAADGVRARDLAWMLFRPDRALRDAAVKLLARVRDPETFDAFAAEAKGKPDAALRAAIQNLTALGIPGLDQRLAQLLAAPVKETKETKETQALGRRILLDTGVNQNTAALLWQLAFEGPADERLQFVNKLATVEQLDNAWISRWQKLAADPEENIRDKALEVLAQRAPDSSIDLFVQELPRANYNTKQALVEALTRAASAQGLALVDRLLPLVAAGDAATRTAIMKILLGAGDVTAVVRRYLLFVKTLAGFVRERALDLLRTFGDQLLEPIIALLHDSDADVRSSAIAVASTFEDPRVVPAAIELLKDPDWWLRISAADTLGKFKDPRAVEPLVAALGDAETKWAAVEALGRIGDPRALPALGKMLADPAPDVRIEVIQALRHFNHPQVKNALIQVAQNDANRAVRTRAVDLLGEIASLEEQTQVEGVRKTALATVTKQGEPRLHVLLNATRNQGGSDFHLTVGQPPTLRLAADLLRAQGEPFTSVQTEEMLKEILNENQFAVLQQNKQLDFCYYIPNGGRYRGNVFLDQKGYNAVFRVIPEKPPTIAEIGLPSHLAEIADYHQGLVLICGPSGSGKSTTLAALVNLFNETRNDHVLTLEDPVEFVHPFKNCLINQREVGTNTVSYARALRAALREDPDVIVIGELRDNESIALALTAAETGHIVLGTLNSTSAAKAVDRIISSFPVDEQPQVRASLSESMKYVIAQRLLPSKEPRKLVAAFEVLKGTATIGNMIRDEKTFQIYSAMQIGRSQGMQTFDDALKDLVERQKISGETAYMVAQKKEDFEPFVSESFLKGAR
ncbi:MAG TPA: PilT/PilU family type 4a pilus ATPase [Thermoanaerobaculia bacterium]|nr:PilT/PilU family type 4a pilus ATPase [Thermoanaerobaculia bacterium]